MAPEERLGLLLNMSLSSSRPFHYICLDPCHLPPNLLISLSRIPRHTRPDLTLRSPGDHDTVQALCDAQCLTLNCLHLSSDRASFTTCRVGNKYLVFRSHKCCRVHSNWNGYLYRAVRIYMNRSRNDIKALHKFPEGEIPLLLRPDSGCHAKSRSLV